MSERPALRIDLRGVGLLADAEWVPWPFGDERASMADLVALGFVDAEG